MTSFVIVREDAYFDSVQLMAVSARLEAWRGVANAVVALGTPHNREYLAGVGYEVPSGVGPNDLIIAVRGTRFSEAELVEKVDELLRQDTGSVTEEDQPRTLAAALAARPDANLVLISVPGQHAAREARRALALGRHVMIFSDNVSVEDEIGLKQEGQRRGFLVMGPDCGTAIIGGKPLAFANVVRRGPIGIVGASGTGIQEVSCCIDRLGGGVSHAVGTGGRDLSEAVGGITTRMGIAALAEDLATEILCVVSKPPAPAVADEVIAAVAAAGKPAVIHFVGEAARPARGVVRFADSLAGAAELACSLAGVDAPGDSVRTDPPTVSKDARLVGLFCGGTTGHEALTLLSRAGLEVHSNLHGKVTEAEPGHVLLDMGDDQFTRGRPHPMIEPALRNERLLHEVRQATTELLLFDVMLGYGSHPSPGRVLAEGLADARARASRSLVAIASITGTHADPQGLTSQRRTLVEAGVTVAPDNRAAAELAARVLEAHS